MCSLSLLDTPVLLISISFIEVGFYTDEIRILQFQCHQMLQYFYPFLYVVLFLFKFFSDVNLYSKSLFFKIIVSYNCKKAFFSHSIIFLYTAYTQQVFLFHLLRDFCNVHDHIFSAFFFSFFRKTLMSFASFFLQSFLCILRHFYIYEKKL